MIKISSIGKYLDQPILTAKLNKNVPLLMGTGAGVILLDKINEAPEGKKTKTGIKSAIILATTTFSAIKAPEIAAKITKRECAKPLASVIAENYVHLHR